MSRLTDPKCYYAGYMGFTVKEFKERLIMLGEYEDLEKDPAELKEIMEHQAAPDLALQKAFALACRILDEEMCCPRDTFDGIDWPECDGMIESCSDHGKWKCWQKYLQERVDAEQVCRVCGCTEDNACPGGCSWVERDRCSACVEKEKHDE